MEIDVQDKQETKNVFNTNDNNLYNFLSNIILKFIFIDIYILFMK